MEWTARITPRHLLVLESPAPITSTTQILMLFVPVNCETYEARVGLVGSTLMGRSQLKVSTSTCSAPVHTVTSDWFCRTTGASTGSLAVTNSKCKRHLNITGEEENNAEWECFLYHFNCSFNIKSHGWHLFDLTFITPGLCKPKS